MSLTFIIPLLLAEKKTQYFSTVFLSSKSQKLLSFQMTWVRWQCCQKSYEFIINAKKKKKDHIKRLPPSKTGHRRDFFFFFCWKAALEGTKQMAVQVPCMGTIAWVPLINELWLLLSQIFFLSRGRQKIWSKLIREQCNILNWNCKLWLCKKSYGFYQPILLFSKTASFSHIFDTTLGSGWMKMRKETPSIVHLVEFQSEILTQKTYVN